MYFEKKYAVHRFPYLGETFMNISENLEMCDNMKGKNILKFVCSIKVKDKV